MTDVVRPREDTRARIVEVAAQLLREQGPAAVTTRGVAHGAGVQAPTIYRLFGDKDGLLEAVAERALADFTSVKASVVETAAAQGVDPLVDLRAGWDTQIAFGLENPDLFRLLNDPARFASSPAAAAGLQVLRARVHRIAEAGRLRVSEQRAVGLIQAAGVGSVQTMLAQLAEQRDAGLADEAYEAVLRQILVDAPPREGGDDAAAIIAFRAVAPQLEVLTAAERALLLDWLDRAIAGSA
ncbi:TetR/AcrR family transcriptional regulator [Microbacterium sp. P04]|uniref:TetR/AcrR family transcriptional regulator n=1 Tax=Microbacterium sp. P04 TaxID=3366947 RepID=UPI00374534B8